MMNEKKNNNNNNKINKKIYVALHASNIKNKTWENQEGEKTAEFHTFRKEKL